ncbi:MAG: hypothetical protein LBQ49_03015 [Rickettsiales bacterium]|jgi:hypothetical protein|nr:hypothetical protein [Rickettsiales bacterium]
MQAGMDGLGIFLAMALGAAALILTVLKPGRNDQAILAVGTVAVLSMNFLIGAAAFTWALFDLGVIKISKEKAKK